MWDGAVAAEVYVPPVGLGWEVNLRDAALEHVEPLLALRAPHQLSHLWDQHIHRRHRLAVLVLAHVERLDALGVVADDDGDPVVHLFRQIPLMLALKVPAPLDGELEFAVGFKELINSLGVGDANKRRVPHLLEPRNQSIVDVLVEKREVFLALRKHVREAVLQVRLSAVHVVVQIGKGEFRFNHPELGKVAGSVAVLGAEGGPKGVDVAEGARVNLSV
mmetsp:Transcript_12407/g.40879  ORF Transcript_12407/g.40879 Transcript_12407/m.40879 type:complete len:219 (-) Transcript_12407:996-1652(-)